MRQKVKVLHEYKENDKILGTILQNNNIKKKCSTCTKDILNEEIYFMLGGLNKYYSYEDKKYCKSCLKIFEALLKANENLIFK